MAQGGFSRSCKNWGCIEILDAGSETTAVVFDARVPGETPQPEQRYGWGFQFLPTVGKNLVFLKPRQNSWYRDPACIEDIIALSQHNIIKNCTVYNIGNSMGGFGALTFSTLFAARATLSVNPQSTLNLDLLEDEPRFEDAQRFDWKGPFSDASEALLASNATHYIIYDPFFPFDRQHIDRLPQNKIVKIFASFIEHQIPHWLASTGLLKPLMHDFLNTGRVVEGFQRDFSSRLKGYRRYYSGLMDNLLRSKGKNHWIDVLCNHHNEIKAMKSVGGADEYSDARLAEQISSWQANRSSPE